MMPMSLRDRAIELMDKKLFREALLLFQKMIKTRHSDWSIFYMAGQCRRFIGDLDGAISYLSQADKLKPDETSVLLSLGIALQLKEFFDEASHKFRRAIIEPNGIEDKEASRRVEFRVETNAEKKIEEILARSQI